jgi:ADP-heptose:LPS heptosyltransferase
MNFTSFKENKIFNFLMSVVLYFFFPFIRSFIKKNKSGKIVVIVLHKLGDSIFAIRAIQEIVNYYQEKVVLVCFPEVTDILKIRFIDSQFLELNHTEFYFSNRIASTTAKKALRKLKPIIIFDLTGNITSASLIYSLPAKQIIGINENIYRSIYSKFSIKRTEPHITDIYLDAIKGLFLKTDQIKKNIQYNIKGSYILIHPFAGWNAKEWNLRKFIRLSEKLNEKFKVKIVVSPNKLSKDIISYIENKHIDLIETKTTVELIKATKDSFLFIGNDSGPIHVANLIGIPTFTIYGPTNPEYHKPLEGLNNFIIKKIRCSPGKNEKVCLTNGGRNGCPSFDCMNLLDTETVLAKVLTFIEELGINSFFLKN